jgi:hypothetical protein
MASQKISQLTAITTVASGDYFPVVQASGTTNKRVEVGVLDARYTSASSGVAAQSTANTALASGNSALVSAATALASGNAALTSAASRLLLTGGTLSGPLTASGFLSASGTIFDTAGNVRDVPPNAQSSLYLAQASDIGKFISVASGVVRVPSGVFTAGQLFSIYNNSVGTQTISGSAGTTLRQAGTTNTGVRSVASYGICTVLCAGSETFVVTGAGLT